MFLLCLAVGWKAPKLCINICCVKELMQDEPHSCLGITMTKIVKGSMNGCLSIVILETKPAPAAFTQVGLYFCIVIQSLVPKLFGQLR